MLTTDDYEQMIERRKAEELARQERLAKVQITTGPALMQKRFPEPRYLWDSVLPDAGLAVMAASKAAGKTLLLLQLADAISKGRDFLGLPTKITKTLFIELELSERRTQQRLYKMGIVPDEMLHFAHQWTQGDEGLHTIEDAVKKHSFGLMVVDVMQMLWPMDADTNSYQDTYGVLSPLRQMANALGVMIVLVTHRRKAETAAYLAGVIGSVGIAANADVVFSLIRTRGEQEAVLHIDGNDIESRKIALRFNTDPLGFILSDATPEEVGLTPERREVMDALRELGGTAKTGEIAARLGKKTADISMLLSRMKDIGLISSPRYGTWAIRDKRGVETVESGESKEERFNGFNTFNGTFNQSVYTGKQGADYPARTQQTSGNGEQLDIF
jgi:DNA-binding transcriptional ArsR family regulator